MFPPSFGRRSVEFVERQRLERGAFVLSVEDDGALVPSNSGSAPQLQQDLSRSLHLSAQDAHDIRDLEAHDRLDCLSEDARVRARGRGGWSAPPPDFHNNDQLQPRQLSASPPSNIEPREDTNAILPSGASQQPVATTNYPPIERPSPALADSFLSTQRRPLRISRIIDLESSQQPSSDTSQDPRPRTPIILHPETIS